MPSKEQLFRIERFPSGRTPTADILDMFTVTNVQIGNNRVRPGTDQHVDNSLQTILSTASGLSSGRAIIFGLGNGIDVPLQKLAAQFDGLTIVEIDEPTATKTIAKLSPDLQEKCELIIDDISGVMDEYLRITNKKRPTYYKPDRIVGDFSKEIDGIEPPVLNFGRGFAFACSSLITSQLGFFPHLIISEHLREKYRMTHLPKDKQSSKEYMLSQTKLAQALHRTHISLLRESVEDNGGKVYFSDTVAEANTRLDERSGQEVFTTKWLPMMQPELFETFIPSRFEVVKEESWVWVKRPAVTGKAGSVFSVWARDLSTKE